MFDTPSIIDKESKRDMVNIENMLDRVIVIDNKKDEISDLVSRLRDYDIAVDDPELTDDDTQLPVYQRNRQLIFMDLLLDENLGNLITDISRIIQILNHIIGPDFGPYGLVLWTKHVKKMKEVQERFDIAAKTSFRDKESVDDSDDEEISVDISLKNPPIFIIGINKVQFKITGEWDFSTLMPILNQEIQKSNASYFFLRWISASRKAAQDSISGVYSLTDDYEKKEAEISHLLYRLALNQTGINHQYPGLTADAYKAFSDILHPRINALTGREKLPDFASVTQAYDASAEIDILAKLNTILFIDSVGLDQNEIVPGNVYEIKDSQCPVIVSEQDRIVLKNQENKNGYKDYPCIPVVIELTPPCLRECVTQNTF